METVHKTMEEIPFEFTYLRRRISALEEALRESEERYHALFEDAYDGICIIQDGVFKAANPELRLILGCEESDLVGHPFTEVLHPDVLGEALSMFAEYMRGMKLPGAYETILRKRGGERIYAEVSGSIVQYEGREASMITLRDVTSRKNVEASLHKTEERYRRLVENANDLLWQVDLSGVFTFVSPTVRKLMGYEPKELIGKGLEAVLTPESVVRARTSMQRRLAGELGREGVAMDLFHRRRDGSEFLGEIVTTPLFDAGGQLQGVQGVTRDVTARRAAELRLRESENTLRALLNSITESIVLIRPDGEVVTANEAFCSRLGVSLDTLTGKDVLSFMPPEVAEERRTRAEQVLQERRPITFEDNRGSYAFEATYYPVLDDEGRVQYLVIVGVDISQRRNMETSLRESEAERLRLATAIEQSAESVVITDVTGAIQYVNPAFEQTTGYRREEVLGRNPRMLRSGKHDAAFYRTLWRTLTQGRVWHGRFINRRKDGSLYDEDATISPVRNGRGEIIHYVALKRDITHEVSLEKQLRQSLKMEAIGTLAGGIAHDLRNILALILGHGEIALRSLVEEHPVRENIDHICKAGNRASDLVKRILTFSRRQDQERKPLRIAQVVNETIKLLRGMIPPTVEIRQTLEDGGLVLADATQIQEVIVNLCTNAYQAMGPHGGVLKLDLQEVEVRQDQVADAGVLHEGRYARLRISDTGNGIPTADLPYIFDPFFTTKKPGEGTGLGLSMVHGAVLGNGGAILVDSQPGKGSTFDVYLPSLEEEEEMGAGELMPPACGTERILLVDDEEDLVFMESQLLEGLGYTVTAETSSTAALERFRENPDAFDLLILDNVMPKLTGVELSREALSIRPNIPILLMTGYSEGVTADQAKLMGIAEFLMKPFSTAVFSEAIRRVLS